MKPFIPKNIRETKMPLNFSNKFKKDSQYVNVLSEIRTILKEAKQVYKEWKKTMAGLAKKGRSWKLKGGNSYLSGTNPP